MRIVTVYGAQNSGTRWFCNLISKHPQVKCIQHSSIPAGKHNSASERIAKENPRDFEDTHSFLFVVRDASCVRGAWEKKGKNHPASSAYFKNHDSSLPIHKVYDQDIVKNYNASIEALIDWIGDVDIPYTFGSYETMLQFKESYLKKILKDLKLDPSLYPWNIINSTEYYEFLGEDPSGGKDIYYSKREYCLMTPIDGNEKYFKK